MDDALPRSPAAKDVEILISRHEVAAICCKTSHHGQPTSADPPAATGTEPAEQPRHNPLALFGVLGGGAFGRISAQQIVEAVAPVAGFLQQVHTGQDIQQPARL
jgi:hypothetical protein